MALKDRYNNSTAATPPEAATPPSTPPTTSAVGTPAPDLAAVRARLAQRQSPGVNPPEAEVPPTAFERTTQELADGSVVSVADASGVEPTAPALTAAQKAAATRAANKERKPRNAAVVNGAVASATPGETEGAMTELGRVIFELRRIACALEKGAK